VSRTLPKIRYNATIWLPKARPTLPGPVVLVTADDETIGDHAPGGLSLKCTLRFGKQFPTAFDPATGHKGVYV
jgi:hypothetical protein